MEKLGQPKMTPLKRSEFISDMRTTASLAPSAMAGWVSRRGSLPSWVPCRVSIHDLHLFAWEGKLRPPSRFGVCMPTEIHGSRSKGTRSSRAS